MPLSCQTVVFSACQPTATAATFTFGQCLSEFPLTDHAHPRPQRGGLALLHTGFHETTLRVQAMHNQISAYPFRWLQQLSGMHPQVRMVQSIHDAITAGTYAAIRQGGGGALKLAAHLETAVLKASSDAPAFAPDKMLSQVVSALNGAVGDHLHETDNLLAIKMGLRVKGQRVPAEASALHSAVAAPTGRVVVFIHGLACDEHCWQLYADTAWPTPGQDYAQHLQADFGFTALYVRYNTGLAIEDNGQQFARLLDQLLEAYPVPITDLVLVGHSMGGLVARAACVAGEGGWRAKTRLVICLGSPNEGAPLAKVGHVVHTTMERFPVTRPLAEMADARSQGVKDLQHGLGALDNETGGCACAYIGATLLRDPEHPLGHWLGDGLVHISSAARGQERIARIGGLHHMTLLNHPAVYAQMREWLGAILPSPV